MKKTYTHVIWDYNGTILDDVRVGIDTINEMLAPRSMPTLDSVEAYQAVFDFPVTAYYQRLGFDFAKEDFQSCLAPLWVSINQRLLPNATLFEGVRPLTRALRSKGIPQSILTASEGSAVREQLRARKALEWFDEIWGCDSIHAYGKEGVARAWRNAHPDAVAVMLGDTTHDFAVAQEIGADCILIAAGHHSRERLLTCGVPVVEDLSACATLLLSDV